MTELEDLIRQSVEAVKAMTPEEQAAMLVQQRASWVRSIVDWPKPRYQWVNGVKVYESYEDYCND